MVRSGKDYIVPTADGDSHNALRVYQEMVLQIATEYSGLPDVRTMRFREIKFFYDGMRNRLHELTKPQ